MNWSTQGDIKKQLVRLWERGDLLRPLVAGGSAFPLRLAFKGPGSGDVTDRFDAVRVWAAELSVPAPMQLEWRGVRHRVQGTQHLPCGVQIATLDDALRLLGKRRDADSFLQLLEATRSRCPALLPWLERRPLQALALASDWPRLLAVVDWMLQHPRPGVYLRQVDVAGVHTKFIESHRAVLAEWFDLVLAPAQVQADCTGVGQFAARYGFLDKPVRIRFRVLDPALQLLAGLESPDVTLDANSFARLQLAVKRVFITENETNFLAFPRVQASLVLFGAGYGWEGLARAKWLHQCSVHYWGDIDTHGFGILDQLRSHFPGVQSFLMDRPTLDAHQAHWGEEPTPLQAELTRLSPAEAALYADLRHNRIRSKLRLEQERVAYSWLTRTLQRT